MAQPRGVLGGRAAILLTAAVGVLSIVTGIANIGTTAELGFLVSVIPRSVSQTAGFTGTLTGFLMLLGSAGLSRRLRMAWYATMVLLPVTAVQGLVQSSPLSVPLVVLSLVSLPTVYLNRRRFDKPVTLTPIQSAALVAIVGVQVYGSVGAYALRDQFTGLTDLTDAFYYTLVTASTVGYGDVTPQTPIARLFGMTVVVLGTASFAAAIGVVLGPAIEARLASTLGRMTETRYDLLEDHIIILGYGDLTEPLLDELGDAAHVIVVPDSERAAELRQRGFNVQTGEPSNEDTLEQVGIGTARAALAATNQDGEDALSILTAHQQNPNLRIVAAATERENMEKLRRAGATTVISPQVIGAHLLVQSALGDTSVEAVAERLLDDELDPNRGGK